MNLKMYLNKRPGLKQVVHRLLIPHNEARPRWWVSWLVNPFVHQRHRSSIVRLTARLDVLPFNAFSLGSHSIIEDYCVINNGVGEVSIGPNSHIGIGTVVIGPTRIGANVIIGQHVVLSGLNHVYEDIQVPIRNQPIRVSPIVIDDDCWLGANVTICAGVTIGKHAVVAGGSVVTESVLPFTVVGGNPARILKRYDRTAETWVSES